MVGKEPIRAEVSTTNPRQNGALRNPSKTRRGRTVDNVGHIRNESGFYACYCLFHRAFGAGA